MGRPIKHDKTKLIGVVREEDVDSIILNFHIDIRIGGMTGERASLKIQTLTEKVAKAQTAAANDLDKCSVCFERAMLLASTTPVELKSARDKRTAATEVFRRESRILGRLEQALGFFT